MKGATTVYYLTTPREADLLAITSELKTLPGRGLVITDTDEFSYIIWFCTTLPRKELAATLKEKLNIPDQVEKRVKKRGKTVYQYDKDWNLIATFRSGCEASAVTKIGRSCIFHSAENPGTPTRGFYFLYGPKEKINFKAVSSPVEPLEDQG